MAGTKKHNAHLLVPKRTWDRARRIAKREDVTMTELVTEGLLRVIASRKSDDVDDKA